MSTEKKVGVICESAKIQDFKEALENADFDFEIIQKGPIPGTKILAVQCDESKVESLMDVVCEVNRKLNPRRSNQ